MRSPHGSRPRETGTDAVEVADVTHGQRAPGLPVLHEVSFSARPGEVLALEGRSGSGKSTLCQLIAGLEPPDRGAVTVLGGPAAAITDWSVVSFLPQRFGLAAELTVAENAAFPCWMAGQAEPTGLYELLDLAHLTGRLPSEVSLGEQQRTALARAMALQPDVLVLDEPTSHQDEDHVDVVTAALAELAGGGTTVVVATHDPRVVAIAGRVVHLRAGRHAQS